MKKFISYGKNVYNNDEINAVLKTLKNTTQMGKSVFKFEKKMANYLKIKNVVGLSSGSSALYLALKALNIKKGDEVITTPFTWIITVNAILEAGAKPIFVDIKDDFNIDPEKISSKITKKTKAV